MPLRVVHPVRLVVDHPEVGNEALVGEALRTALTAAITASVEEVLAGQADGTGVRVHPAELTFAPSPAPALTQEQRARLATCVDTAIAGALADTGVATGVFGDGDGEGARAARGEPVDEARIHRVLRRYVVPSYGGDTSTAVVILGGEDFTVETFPPGRDWTPVDGRNLERVYLAELARRRYPTPAQGLQGIIFRGRQTGRINIGAVRYPDGELVHNFALDYLNESYVDPQGNLAMRSVSLSAESAYTLSWEGSVAEIRSVMTRFYAKDFARLLRENVDRGPLQDFADYAQAIDDRVAAAIEAQIERYQLTAGCFLRLGVDGSAYLITMTPPYPMWIREGLDITLIPLTEEAPPAGEGEEPGTGTGAPQAPGTGEEEAGTGPRGEEAGTVGTGAEWGERAGTRPFTPGQAVSLVETGDERATQGTVYPQVAQWGLFALTQNCTAFQGEPSVEELGEAAAGLRSLMTYIAARLEMQPCDHIGAFLIDCGRFLGERAVQVARAGDLGTGRSEAPASGVRGNLGDLHFVPAASVAVQLMRQLAGTVPLISRLSRDYQSVLQSRDQLIKGMWSGKFLSWQVRFVEEFTPGVAHGVGQVFAMTSSVVFGQVLRSSAEIIHRALDHLPQTAQAFNERVLPMLIDVDQYTTWRDRLQDAIDLDLRRRMNAARFGVVVQPITPEYIVPPAAPASTAAERAAAAREAWRGAASGTVQALAGQRPADHPATSERAGEVVRTAKGFRILDTAGRPRSIEQLEELIILARGTAESIEPLVKHIDDLPAAVSRMRAGQQAVERELRSILNRMAFDNALITREAADDVTYGFGATSMHEDIAHATVPGSKYVLIGIHALAHAELKEFFAGDRFYALGVDHVMDTEVGRRSLAAFGEMVGLVLISVFCPPAGIVLGIELAAYHLAEAYERQMLYEALVDPDLVLSKAEVELGLFAAWFGFALSFLPVLGKVAGALGKAATPVAEAAAGEAAAGARLAAGTAAEEAALAAARTVGHDLLMQFVRDLALNEALSRGLGLVLAPVFEHLRHRLETRAAVGGMDRALALVIARHRAAAPLQPKETPR